MSKFIDKLKQLSQTAPEPMGFKAAAAATPKPKMLLVARVADFADVAGADAGVISLTGPGAKSIKEALKAAPDIPWGGWLGDSVREDIKPLIAECDFLVFPSNAALTTLPSDKVGKVLEVPPSLGDGLLRAVEELPVDAVLMDSALADGQPLTWNHLMQFQRCANLLTKPVLVSVSHTVTSSELQAMHAVGVKGIVVEVKAGQPAGRLAELRQAIDKIVLPAPANRRRPMALIPNLGAAVAEEAEEEEE